MKKLVTEIVNIILWILFFPIYLLRTPYDYYKSFRGFDERVYYLLTFGRFLIGGYHGKIRIGTRENNYLYESDNFDIFRTKARRWLFRDEDNRNISSLMKMRVYCFWIDKDGYLFIKVFRNDKLIEKHRKEIGDKKEEIYKKIISSSFNPSEIEASVENKKMNVEE